MSQQEKRVDLSKNAKYTINIIQCTIYMNRPKKTLKGEFAKSQVDCPDGVRSDQIVIETVREEAGPHDRQPKALKTKLTRGRPSDSSLSTNM